MKKWMRIAIGVIAILACTQIGIFAVQNHRNQKREESETTVQSAGTETQEKDTAEKNTVDSEAAKQEKSNSGIIVKSNVKVITKDTEYEEQPFEISDHSMKFEKDPGYQEGDVIVARKNSQGIRWTDPESSSGQKGNGWLLGRNRRCISGGCL